MVIGSSGVRAFAIRRRPGRRMFEVRWRVAGRDKSRSFITWALAGSYRAELIRAAHRGRRSSAPPAPASSPPPHAHRSPPARYK